MTVNLNGLERLGQIIDQGLGLTNGNLLKEINDSSKRILRRGARVLRTTSPEKSGEYRQGWSIKKVGTKWVLYNKNKYQLTHLLEDGHNGKDNSNPVAAIPHIRPLEQIVIDDFISEVERILRG